MKIAKVQKMEAPNLDMKAPNLKILNSILATLFSLEFGVWYLMLICYLVFVNCVFKSTFVVPFN
ncbi:MAG: hypothetical protein ACTIJ9_05790 [Aequorivita sp.]